MKKRTVWIIVIALILVIAAVAVWWILRDKDSGNESNTTPEGGTTAETVNPAELMEMPALEGDTGLLEERQELVNQNILDQIEMRTLGRPSVNEEGNYVALENGELFRKENENPDYSNYEANAAILINAFADKGYSDTAINQIQRMYFHYWRAYSIYSTDELINKLGQCIPAGGTSSEALTKKAYDVFGHVREDGFAFVFKDEQIGYLKISCYQVDPYFIETLTLEQEAYCLYDALVEEPDGEYERNLEKWLHAIVYHLDKSGYGKHEMTVAQLLYTGSLCSSEYHPDEFERIVNSMETFAKSGQEAFSDSVKQNFDVDVNENLLLAAYLNGEVSFD